MHLSSRGKARSSPSSLRSLYWRERELLSPARIILTTHPCSYSRPMVQPVLAGTLSIVNLQRRSDSGWTCSDELAQPLALERRGYGRGSLQVESTAGRAQGGASIVPAVAC